MNNPEYQTKETHGTQNVLENSVLLIFHKLFPVFSFYRRELRRCLDDWTNW